MDRRSQWVWVVVLVVMETPSQASAQWIRWPVDEGGNGNFYRYSSTLGSWQDAEAQAVAEGGHLASINSAAENAWLYKVFGSIPIAPPENGAVWIGLRRSGDSWEWTDGRPFEYTNWAPGEPNNFEGNENYAWMYSDTEPTQFALWNDAASPSIHYAFRGIMELRNPDIPALGNANLAIVVASMIAAGAWIIRRRRTVSG